jgi:hypothetical protein
MKTLLHRLVLPLEWLLALVILFEEWGWEPLQRFMARLARWPAVASVERRIGALRPMPALLAFALPSLLLLPVNLFGLWLAGEGRAVLSATLIVAAKLSGTTLVARIFTLTRPALLELPWFARLYRRWQILEAALLAPVRASWAWRTGRTLKRRWAEWRKRQHA